MDTVFYINPYLLPHREPNPYLLSYREHPTSVALSCAWHTLQKEEGLMTLLSPTALVCGIRDQPADIQ